MDSTGLDTREDRDLRSVRSKLLARHAPGTRTQTVSWSAGRAPVLELGEGPPLVLVHGGLGEATNWVPVMPLLAQRFHVYAVDRPGHGLADPFDYRGVDLLAHARTFLGDVLDALGLDAPAVVGNSMGGRWAVEYALQNPNRVSRLVLVGAPAGSTAALPKEFFAVVDLLRLIHRPVLGRLVRSAMRKPSSRKRAREGLGGMVAHPERLGDELLDSGTFNFLRNSASMLGLVERVVDGMGPRPEFSGGIPWATLRVPTDLVWGERDAFDTVGHGREIADRVPQGRFALVPDAGHLPWLDEPAVVAREIAKAVESGGEAA